MICCFAGDGLSAASVGDTGGTAGEGVRGTDGVGTGTGSALLFGSTAGGVKGTGGLGCGFGVTSGSGVGAGAGGVGIGAGSGAFFFSFHFAFNVRSPVTVWLSKSHNVLSRYQPRKS